MAWPKSAKRIDCKNAPDVTWLCKASEGKLCTMHCLLPLRGALYKIAQKQQRGQFFEDDRFQLLRCHRRLHQNCMQYVQNPEKRYVSSYTRFMKKASAAEKAMVDEVISYLSLEAVETLPGTSSGGLEKQETAGPEGPGSELTRTAAAGATTTTAATEDFPASEGWSLDEALHEMTKVRSDLHALLQPRAKAARQRRKRKR